MDRPLQINDSSALQLLFSLPYQWESERVRIRNASAALTLLAWAMLAYLGRVIRLSFDLRADRFSDLWDYFTI